MFEGDLLRRSRDFWLVTPLLRLCLSLKNQEAVMIEAFHTRSDWPKIICVLAAYRAAMQEKYKNVVTKHSLENVSPFEMF